MTSVVLPVNTLIYPVSEVYSDKKNHKFRLILQIVLVLTTLMLIF